MLAQASRFKGVSQQSLRNVSFHAATIIWVQKGRKRLQWKGEPVSYDASQWLPVPAGHYLTFVNLPKDSSYESRALTFLAKPPPEWLERPAEQSLSQEPRIAVTPGLAYCFDTLFHMEEKKLCAQAQQQFLFGFFAELNRVAALSLLFPERSPAFQEKIAHYLSVDPGADHRLEAVADRFFMSRSTLIRKLSLEGTTFRKILTDVRMVHALSLLQRPRQQLFSIALSCGYRSQARFSRRFKKTFGVTPREYRKTI